MYTNLHFRSHLYIEVVGRLMTTNVGVFQLPLCQEVIACDDTFLNFAVDLLYNDTRIEPNPYDFGSPLEPLHNQNHRHFKPRG